MYILKEKNIVMEIEKIGRKEITQMFIILLATIRTHFLEYFM